MPESAFEPAANAITNFDEHVISFSNAAALIYAYAGHYAEEALAAGAGAEISRDALAAFEEGEAQNPDSTIHSGLMLYYCFDEDTSKYFIAWKAEPEMDDEVTQFPVEGDASFFRSDSTFTFNEADIESNDTLAEAITNFSRQSEYNSASINGSNLNDCGNAFLSRIADEDILRLPIAFIHHKQVSDLITQNDNGSEDEKCIGIRLYLGFEEVSSFKFRLIAFAIDGNGKNIITDYNNRPARIMERSWPPY